MLPSEFNQDAAAQRRLLREAARTVPLSPWQSNPKVKKFVKKAFPDYRKRAVRFHVGDNQSVTLSGGYWDGGSRTEWFGLRPDGSRFPLTYPTNPPQYGGGKPPSVKITDTQLVARGGSFASKPTTLTFYVTEKVAKDLGI